MKPNYVVKTYLEMILNEYQGINCAEMMEANKEAFQNILGLSDKNIALIEKALRTRFYYWRKFTSTKPNTPHEDPKILSEYDLEFIKKLTDERVIRLPIGTVRWDEDEKSYITNHDRECELLAIEVYERGHFGCDIYAVTPKDFDEFAEEAARNPDTFRSWAYVNISPHGSNLRAY